MNRRNFLQMSAAGVGTALSLEWIAKDGVALAFAAAEQSNAAATISPLTSPSTGNIPVAFALSDGAVMIDFAGPWEVFQDTSISGNRGGAFELFTVAESTAPIRASAGMRIVPDYTFANAPAPKIIVIPAQRGNDALLEWIRLRSKMADVTASICTGAFILAKTGLLSGKSVTTHHGAYHDLAAKFSDIRVVAGARYVDEGNLASSGGLSSGIDLALHIVERYFGHEVAMRTADRMEYQGTGWTDPASNRRYAERQISRTAKPACAVCAMEVEVATALSSKYKDKTYYFCSTAHKEAFDAAPQKFA